MSYTTGPLPTPTTDRFDLPGAVTLRSFGAKSALVVVTNNAAVLQIAEPGGRPDSAPAWGDEFYAPPGAYPLDAEEGIDGIRARSATPGKPANVSMVAFG